MKLNGRRGFKIDQGKGNIEYAEDILLLDLQWQIIRYVKQALYAVSQHGTLYWWKTAAKVLIEGLKQ